MALNDEEEKDTHSNVSKKKFQSREEEVDQFL